MKLIIVLLTTAIMQVSAASYAQRITLSTKNAPLTKVFKEITQQSNYTFLYTAQMLENTKPVTLNIKDLSLNDALKQCFEDQPLSFTIKDRVIIVSKKEPTILDKVKEAFAPPKSVFGRVVDARHQPLPNATVILKRTKGGTLSDQNGYFTIKDVLANDTLIVTFIGYQKAVVGIGGQAELEVVLQEATSSLDQVVVQAYGTTSQRITTSDIGKVTAEEIERQPVLNPLLALQGKVAGLTVSQTNGFASAPIKVEIRGRNAIGPPNTGFPADPLYIIDGVPLTVLEPGNTRSSYNTGSTGFIQSPAGTGTPAGGQSPLFSVNPSDIESIEVLKDASATAIYGSRGANGVILITTKKGKSGKTQFSLHVQEGVDKVTKFYQMLNTPQYLAMRREAYKNDNLPITLANGAYDLLLWDNNSYTDWQKELYGGMGKATDAQGSVSGGDANNTFRIAAGYNNTKNILTVSGGDQRASAAVSFNHRSTDQRFNISFSGNYTYTRSDMISLPGSATLAPNAPSIYDANGNLNYAGWGGNTNNQQARNTYPFSGLKRPYIANTDFLNSSLNVSYQLFKGFQANINFGYNKALANQEMLTPIASQDPLRKPTGSNYFNSNNNTNLLVEPQLTYDKVIGKGKFSVLLGASAQETKTQGQSASGSGYTSDQLIGDLGSAATTRSLNNFGEYRYAGLFGRISYNWEGKYLIDLNGRRDGSSRFGSGKQYGNFGAAGVAWIFTEESWLKNALSFLSFGKLKGSYGTTGSDGVGDYGYLTRYSSENLYPYNGSASLLSTQFANTDFQWQVNKKLEASLDLGFLKDRITVSAVYYRNHSGNQLVAFPTPAFSGFTSVIANSPALVQNAGWEFTANARIINRKDFKWSLNFNTSFNTNKLLAYPNFALSPYVGLLQIGQSLNVVRRTHFTGVDPLTGAYTYQDKNNDGKYTFDDSGLNKDDTYFLNLSPKFDGGLGMNLSYKSLAVSLFFHIVDQLGKNAYLSSNFPAPGTLNNQPVEVLGRWQKPGDITDVAKFSTNNSTLQNGPLSTSDYGYTDASFIRLSNLAVSYRLPAEFSKKIGVPNCSIFFHTNNLFVITKYKGLDPETQNFGQMPPAKTIVLGLSLDF